MELVKGLDAYGEDGCMMASRRTHDLFLKIKKGRGGGEGKYIHMVPVLQNPKTRTFMGTMRLHCDLSMSDPSRTRIGVPRISYPAMLKSKRKEGVKFGRDVLRRVSRSCPFHVVECLYGSKHDS